MGLITVLTDDKNEITKTILNKNLETKASGHIQSGKGQTVDVSMQGLLKLIEGLSTQQCLSTGIVEAEGLDDYHIFSRSNAPPGGVTRTSEFFTMSPESGWMLFDIDKQNVTEVLEAVIEADSDFAQCGMLAVPSCSSWLKDEETGEWLSEGKSIHIYVEVTDTSLIPEYGRALFKRMILNGHGSIHVVKTSGAKLLRTIIDAEVWKSSNREIFESNPICCDGVVSERLSKIELEPGPSVNLNLGNVSLSPEEDILYHEIVAKLKSDPDIMLKSSNEKRRGFKVRANRSGCSVSDILKGSMDDDGIMALGASEIIKDNNGHDLLIEDILSNPLKFKDKGIPDPVDFYKRGDKKSNRVGRDIARIRYDEITGRVFIYSFYGGIEYDLLWDFNSILKKVDSFLGQDELEDWLDELFDIEVGCTWTGYRLSATELSEIAKEVAAINKSHKAGGGRPSKYGTDAASAKAAFKSRNQDKLTAGSKIVKKMEDTPGFIAKINKKHGIGMYGGKAKIIVEEYKEELGIWEPRFIDIQQLKTFYAEDRTFILDNGRKKEVDIFSAWELNEKRNKFDRIHFKPDAATFRGCGNVPVIQQGGKYNMWMGFLANLDNKTRCKKILWHLRYIWCGGHDKMYMWLLKWLSELFQHPERIGQPYVVLKSMPGAGKNIIVDGVIGKLLGVHSISTSNKNDIIGDFNHRLGINVFCFLNEAFFAGSKTDRSAMKTLIDEQRTVTRKYVDSEHSKNMSKIMLSSNEENVAGTEFGDRRYCYLPVSDDKKGDSKYFKELKMEIENGGREAFLDFMLKFKSDLDLNVLPNEGQSQQRLDDIIYGSETPVKFLYDLLENGITVGVKDRIVNKISNDDFKSLAVDWEKEMIYIDKESLLVLYLDYCDTFKADNRYGRRDAQSLFKSFGDSGIQVYVSNKKSREVKEKYPMAAYKREGRIMVKLWKREEFRKTLSKKLLGN